MMIYHCNNIYVYATNGDAPGILWASQQGITWTG